MPRHVLVPIDGSDHADAGLEYCLTSFPDASLTALYVVDPTHDHEAAVGSQTTSIERAEERGDQVLERAASRAADRGRKIETVRRTGTPHTEILSLATDDVDHIVLGSHGESPITSPFLGRVSEAVVRRTPVSTTLVPESTTAIRDRDLPGDVLIPVDGSAQADAALAYALETFPDATHTVFHALSLPFDRPRSAVEGTYLEAILTDREERAEAVFESATTIADELGPSIETATADGKPAQSILEYAETNGCDQIVLGAHGRSLRARLLGSVAERVARRSPRTVTLVQGDPRSTTT
ncbi:UspA domain protein (plasmid) [Natrialba magadii ATCC 43099]|uniref:UspA domain protein n=1 Tax=Natrialba magadii (strain ATCC 43099 / DSM 3394 / CCM 3739 / CIP 104546 / IAM 13178 / JCM 8861 / NBRC 102185 / NCIMB 2190 / MS3) TaxID=547559 RepID=D3T1A6_NATMM|nr:universal stress protein [Natrialba magadii]ADD07365.1 UspA domain protein [Natrialba magadii ATCC 43099]ELY32435.1 UspA domain-containing protein [Natrialba magadii ATCC 43099]